MYFEVVGVVFRTRCSSNEVDTAFANDIMPTILADRYRKFEDYVDSGCDFAPDLWASSPQQSPPTINAAESFHSHLNADIKTPPLNTDIFFNRSHVNTSLHIDWFTGIHASAF